MKNANGRASPLRASYAMSNKKKSHSAGSTSMIERTRENDQYGKSVIQIQEWSCRRVRVGIRW